MKQLTGVGLTAVVLASLLASGCGERREPTAPTRTDRVTVTLDRVANVDQICFFQARAQALFAQAALDVTLVPPSKPGAALQDLAAERTDLALADQPTLLVARGGGAPFVSIATVLREPQWKLAPAAKGAKAPPHPWSADGLPVKADGLPQYPGMLVITRRPEISGDGSVARRFVQALARGCAAAKTDPLPGLRAIRASQGRTAQPLTPADARRLMPQLEPPAGKPWGWQDPASWDAMLAWMTERNLVGRSADPDAGYTNEFLAGVGL